MNALGAAGDALKAAKALQKLDNVDELAESEAISRAVQDEPTVTITSARTGRFIQNADKQYLKALDEVLSRPGPGSQIVADIGSREQRLTSPRDIPTRPNLLEKA